MEFPSQVKEINGTHYTVTQLPMRKWFDLKALVFKNFGPAIGQFLTSLKGMGEEQQSAAVGEAIKDLSKTVDSKTLETLLRTLTSCTTVENESLSSSYEMWWPLHLADMTPFVVFALEVQFGDFLGGLMESMGGTKSPPSKNE